MTAIGIEATDVCHLATAALSGVGEMHTFDDKLLALNGKIDKSDGIKLKTIPDPGGTPAPLLDKMKSGDEEGK